MPTLSRQTREQLLTYDQEFQKLVEQHTHYEEQLLQLSHSSYLNLEDLQREITLKKLKLRVKDAMERYVAERLHRNTPH
jgi:uncharacterized protein YdcH (DUF465 family)